MSPKILDLDELAAAEAPLKVKLGGAEYLLAERCLRTSTEIARLQAALKSAEGKGVEAENEALAALLGAIVPGAPRAEIDRLSPSAQVALLDFWSGDTAERQKDAEAVTANPTSPG